MRLQVRLYDLLPMAVARAKRDKVDLGLLMTDLITQALAKHSLAPPLLREGDCDPTPVYVPDTCWSALENAQGHWAQDRDAIVRGLLKKGLTLHGSRPQVHPARARLLERIREKYGDWRTG